MLLFSCFFIVFLEFFFQYSFSVHPPTCILSKGTISFSGCSLTTYVDQILPINKSWRAMTLDVGLLCNFHLFNFSGSNENAETFLNGASLEELQVPLMSSSTATTATPSSGGADHNAGHQPRIHLSRDDIAPLLALYFKQTHNFSIEGKDVTIYFTVRLVITEKLFSGVLSNNQSCQYFM